MEAECIKQKEVTILLYVYTLYVHKLQTTTESVKSYEQTFLKEIEICICKKQFIQDKYKDVIQ